MTIFVVRIRLSRRDGFFAKHIIVEGVLPLVGELHLHHQKTQGDALGYEMLTEVAKESRSGHPFRVHSYRHFPIRRYAVCAPTAIKRPPIQGAF